MELSPRVEYALAALLELACNPHPDEPMRVKEIADKQSIPDRYLEHILITLRRAGFVYAQRGIRGGYFTGSQAPNDYAARGTGLFGRQQQ